MSTRSNFGQDKKATRSELLTKLADLFRGLPHRSSCESMRPVPLVEHCTCDAGELIKNVHIEVKNLIVELTDE